MITLGVRGSTYKFRGDISHSKAVKLLNLRSAKLMITLSVYDKETYYIRLSVFYIPLFWLLLYLS